MHQRQLLASWLGWQSFIRYGTKIEPALLLRVAANQAWWEYIPSRVRKASGPWLDQFGPPAVTVVHRSTRSTIMSACRGFNNRIAVGSA